MRKKLTADRIRKFKCQAGTPQSFLWDSEVPGLGIRATAGAKVFVYQGRLDGKTLRVKIGDVRSWTIDSDDPEKPGARQEARRLQTLIDQGIDPRDEKKDRLEKAEAKRAEAQRKEHTVGDAWAAYIEAKKSKWSARHYADHIDIAKPGGEKVQRGKGTIKAGPLASLMPIKLNDLTSARVESWLKAEAAMRPARARLAFSLLRALIKWCDSKPEYKGMVGLDICSTRIKKDHIPRMAGKDDCLQKEQLPAWFSAVKRLSSNTISAYLQTLLLTGARREELASLKWENVDFQWNSLTISDKVENERTIPLTPYVRALLVNLPRKNTFVFESPTSASGRVSEPRHAHNRALAVAGIEGLTIHGLRRSFGTLSEWVECPVGVVAQLMGHKPSAIAEKHYRRRPLDLLRMWHEKIEKWILEQAGLEQPEKGEIGLHVVKKA